jgi:hypothetical protein
LVNESSPESIDHNVMIALVKEKILPHFNEQKEIIDLLYAHLTQKEDWFVANLLLLLHKNKDEFSIKDFRIEKENIDLFIEYDNRKIYCEIKYWIDKQREKRKGVASYKLSSYLSDKSGFWKSNLERLVKKRKDESADCYFLIFYVARDYDSKETIMSALSAFYIRNPQFGMTETIVEGTGFYLILMKLA